MYIFHKNALLTPNFHNFDDLSTFDAKICRCDLLTFRLKSRIRRGIPGRVWFALTSLALDENMIQAVDKHEDSPKKHKMSNFKGKTLINVDIAKRIVGKEKGFFLLVPPITLSPLLPRLEGNSRKLFLQHHYRPIPIRLYRLCHVFLGYQILSNR